MKINKKRLDKGYFFMYNLDIKNKEGASGY